jgi:hypothetical protein
VQDQRCGPVAAGVEHTDHLQHVGSFDGVSGFACPLLVEQFTWLQLLKIFKVHAGEGCGQQRRCVVEQVEGSVAGERESCEGFVELDLVASGAAPLGAENNKILEGKRRV